jgi:hypothetical protein
LSLWLQSETRGKFHESPGIGQEGLSQLQDYSPQRACDGDLQGRATAQAAAGLMAAVLLKKCRTVGIILRLSA